MKHLGNVVFGFLIFALGGALNYFGSNPRILYLPAFALCCWIFYELHSYVVFKEKTAKAEKNRIEAREERSDYLLRIQEAELQRLRPKIRIQAPHTNFAGDLLPTGPIELQIVNEGQEETTLSSLQISVRDSPHSSRGYPIMEPIDLANGNSIPFPIRIPGAADIRLRAKVAGGGAEIIKGSRVEWDGKLTRGEILDPVIRDVPAKSNE